MSVVVIFVIGIVLTNISIILFVVVTVLFLLHHQIIRYDQRPILQLLCGSNNVVAILYLGVEFIAHDIHSHGIYGENALNIAYRTEITFNGIYFS